MHRYRSIFLIGSIEIFIGAVTIFFNFVTIIFSANTKSPNVLLFVIIASAVSILLGIGILRLNRTTYYLLLYFSSVILLSKILIFMDVIQLNGALVKAVPGEIKNATSIIYHGFLLLYLSRPNVRHIFFR